MCPDFRRGASAIEKAQEKAKAGGEGFRPFAPSIFWQNDGDERYLLFLNPIEEIPTVDMISFIPIKRKKANGDSYTMYEQVLARTDPSIDESVDPMERDWDGKPRDTSIAVAVELEPLFETVKGRQRPRGFEVKTTEYDRRVRDDEGELTDEVETIIAPVVGFVTQSPHNFFNLIASFDAKRGPIEETPLSISRVGSGSSTAYTIDGFPEQELDFSSLVDYIDGVSYLGDDLDNLLEQIEAAGTDEQPAIIGTYLLDKRLEELADEDRYNNLYEQINESLDRWGGSKKKAAAPEKKQRPSQRKKKDETPAPAKEEEEKPKRNSRKPKKEEDVSKQENPETMGRMDELRKRAAARSAAKSEAT